MLIDNSKSSKHQKVHEWISSETQVGEYGYSYRLFYPLEHWLIMAKVINDNITEFRLVLGDIVHQGSMNERVIDLLNENITMNAVLQLGKVAK